MADANPFLDATDAGAALRVAAVRFEDGGELALAAVLTKLAHTGRLIVVQAVPAPTRGPDPYVLIDAIHAEMAGTATILLIRPAEMAALAILASLRDLISIAMVAVPADDPIPTACLLHDLLGADEVLLVEQDAAGLVLQRVNPGPEQARPAGPDRPTGEPRRRKAPLGPHHARSTAPRSRSRDSAPNGAFRRG